MTSTQILEADKAVARERAEAEADASRKADLRVAGWVARRTAWRNGADVAGDWAEYWAVGQ